MDYAINLDSRTLDSLFDDPMEQDVFLFGEEDAKPLENLRCHHCGDELFPAYFKNSSWYAKRGVRQGKHGHCRFCAKQKMKMRPSSKAASKRREATKRGAVGAGESVQKEILYAAQDGHCKDCKVWFPMRELELEHRIPLSQGGTHTYDNLVLSCGPCNRSKGGLTVEQWHDRRNNG